jgi:hypothetical protein
VNTWSTSPMPANNTRDQLFRLTAFARCAG